jgi:protein SCO1/2
MHRAGLILGLGFLVACQQQAETSVAALPAGCIIGPNDMIGGPISLVNHSGAAVTEQDFQDGMALVYFGFAYCPDICPTALQMEKLALTELGSEGQVIQPILITVDPERDTPETLAPYVSSPSFPEGLQGLTGSPDQIAQAAKAFRVAYQKESDPQSAGAYTVSHTSFFYLMDENWRLAAMFPSSLKPSEAATCLRAGLKREENPG